MANKFDVNRADSKADTFDMADDKDSTAQLFSSMLPFLLLIFLYSGCISVAPESIAGEKERGTIASLLITPVKRSHIALGKIAALSIIALLSGASSAIGTIASVPNLIHCIGACHTDRSDLSICQNDQRGTNLCNTINDRCDVDRYYIHVWFGCQIADLLLSDPDL